MALLEILDSADQFDVGETKIDAATDTINDTLAGGAIGTNIRKTRGSDFEYDHVPMTKQKVISSGSWNMDTTSTVNIAHGLSYTKLVSAYPWINNDGGSIRSPIDVMWVAGDGLPAGLIQT